MSTVEMNKKGVEIAPSGCSRKRRLHRYGDRRILIGKSHTKPFSKESIAVRKKSDLTKPISSLTIRAIAVPGKSAYLLNCPLVLSVIEQRGRVVIRPVGLRDELGLVAVGTSFRSAMDDLGRRFDLLVQKNRCVPPHLQTVDHARVVRILNHLVNWDRYEKDNPLVQPMWGLIREHRSDGSIRIFWLSGPNQARNQESVLPSRDVSPALSEIPENQWFYGSAKSYPDRLEWLEHPESAPDPGDPEASNALWESLPIEATSEPGCWPLKAH